MAPAESQVVTLYANDDLLSSYHFGRGTAGGRVEDGEIVLNDAQLAFHVFADDMISFGFLRDERVNVIDLGALYVPGDERAVDRAPKFALSLFHTLFKDGPQLSYLGAGGNRLRHKEANRILGPLPPEGLYHIEPRVGHTYLLRAMRKGIGTRTSSSSSRSSTSTRDPA